MESRTFKCEGERNDHTLHYKQVFGNVFERRESKCCALLMKHCHKVTDEQRITLQMTQQLFCRQCKATFLLGQTYCIDDQDKFQSVTDTDNKSTECQTPRKMLQSIGISPVSLHACMKTLKSTISEAYKVQADCLKDP